MDIRRIAKGFGWVLAGALLLVALIYVALVAINWSDEAPSQDVLTLRGYLDAPAVADADNGYVYALGLVVAEGQDPVEQGGKRRAYLESLVPAVPAPDPAGFVIAGSGATTRMDAQQTSLRFAKLASVVAPDVQRALKARRKHSPHGCSRKAGCWKGIGR